MLYRLRITQLINNTFSAQSSDSWGKYMYMHVNVQCIAVQNNHQKSMILLSSDYRIFVY